MGAQEVLPTKSRHHLQLDNGLAVWGTAELIGQLSDMGIDPVLTMPSPLIEGFLCPGNMGDDLILIVMIFGFSVALYSRLMI